jgi:hypothetical protein
MAGRSARHSLTLSQSGVAVMRHVMHFCRSGVGATAVAWAVLAGLLVLAGLTALMIVAQRNAVSDGSPQRLAPAVAPSDG